MPITQERMVVLIRAARDYQDAAERMEAYVKRSYKIFADGKGTAESQLEYLALMLELKTLLRDPLNSPATILIEESHFKSTGSRNAAAARRARRARRELGVKPREQRRPEGERKEIELEPPSLSTAPRAIARKGEYFGSITDQAEVPELVKLPKPTQGPISARRPKMTGPKDAKGLYDPDDDDSGAILGSSGRSEEEIMAAIKPDLERDEKREAWERHLAELKGEKEGKPD